MGKLMAIIGITLLIIVVANRSCVIDEQNVIGTYVGKNLKNTKDTVRIYECGYEQMIYSNNGILKIENHGKWEITESGMIRLSHFFFNYDRDFDKYPEIALTSYGELTALVQNRMGEIRFCSGHYEGEGCYYQVDTTATRTMR